MSHDIGTSCEIGMEGHLLKSRKLVIVEERIERVELEGEIRFVYHIVRVPRGKQ